MRPDLRYSTLVGSKGFDFLVVEVKCPKSTAQATSLNCPLNCKLYLIHQLTSQRLVLSYNVVYLFMISTYLHNKSNLQRKKPKGPLHGNLTSCTGPSSKPKKNWCISKNNIELALPICYYRTKALILLPNHRQL